MSNYLNNCAQGQPADQLQEVLPTPHRSASGLNRVQNKENIITMNLEHRARESAQKFFMQLIECFSYNMRPENNRWFSNLGSTQHLTQARPLWLPPHFCKPASSIVPTDFCKHSTPKASKGAFVSTGDPVRISMGQSHAGFNNSVEYTIDGGETWKKTGLDNKTQNTFIINDVPKGTEVKFRILTPEGNSFVAGEIHGDGLDHGKVTKNKDGSQTYNLEDLYGGGDRDFDDVVFTVDSVKPLPPKPSKGAFVSTGDPVRVSMGRSHAAFNNAVEYTVDGGETWKKTGLDNKTQNAFVINEVPRGTEVKFRILTPEGNRFVAGELHDDGLDHGKVTKHKDGSQTYNFEDLYGGGDRDFDDVAFTVSPVIR